MERLPAALLFAVLSSVALGPGRELLYTLLCFDCSLRALERLPAALLSVLSSVALGPGRELLYPLLCFDCSLRALERLSAL